MARIADVTLGSTRFLSIGTPGQDPQVPITGRASGTGSLTANVRRRAHPVTGGEGVSATQYDRYIDRAIPVVCQSNPVHDPVLRDAPAQRRDMTWRPRTATGKPEYTGDAVIDQWTLTGNTGTGIVNWNFRLGVDGDLESKDQT